MFIQILPQQDISLAKTMMRIHQDVTAIATFCTDKHQLPAYGLSLNIIGAKLDITTYEHLYI